MSKRSQIKEPPKNVGARLSAIDPPNYDNQPPIFSLERLQSGKFCLSGLSKTDKAKFADAIFRRRCLSWREINELDRHGLGFEKIHRNSIKAPMPSFITDDKKHFLAFRFSGKKPMVGYRVKNIFFVLWFDSNFKLYNHD